MMDNGKIKKKSQGRDSFFCLHIMVTSQPYLGWLAGKITLEKLAWMDGWDKEDGT